MLPRHAAKWDTLKDATNTRDRNLRLGTDDRALCEADPEPEVCRNVDQTVLHERGEAQTNPCFRWIGRESHSTATVQVQDESKIWRIAIVTFRPQYRPNYISRRVVMDVLHTPIIEELDLHRGCSGIIRSTGHVNLLWCMYGSESSYESIFQVTEEFDPCFDILLGKDTMAAEGVHRSSPQDNRKTAVKAVRKRIQRRRKHNFKDGNVQLQKRKRCALVAPGKS